MPITLPPEKSRQMQQSIKRFMLEQFDEELGELKAGLILEFVLKELAPTIYNQAIADAQTWLQGRVADLEGVCYEEEFGYWPGAKRSRS